MGSQAWKSSGTSPIYPEAVCLLYLIIYFNHKRQLLGIFCPTLQQNAWPSSAQSSLLSSSKSGYIQRPLDDDRTNCIHQQEECTSVGSSPASDQTSFKVQLNMSLAALMCLKFHVWWNTIIFPFCTCAVHVSFVKREKLAWFVHGPGQEVSDWDFSHPKQHWYPSTMHFLPANEKKRKRNFWAT